MVNLDLLRKQLLCRLGYFNLVLLPVSCFHLICNVLNQLTMPLVHGLFRLPTDASTGHVMRPRSREVEAA